jgi:hypothetical protein
VKYCIITTCKGRLSHLKEMSAVLMADPRIGTEWGWVLVDFACPEKSGEWARETWGDRVMVVELELEKDVPFHKPLAQNTGAMHAVEQGAQYLCFIDADTLVTPEFLDTIEASAALDTFLIVPPTMEKRDLTGFLCVDHRHFLRVGGFNIDFVGWGAEDLELRLKLYLKGGLSFVEIPALASSIPHDDGVRTANYEDKDKNVSHGKNLNRLCSTVMDWTGSHLVDLYKEEKRGSDLRRLLGVESISPRRILL